MIKDLAAFLKQPFNPQGGAVQWFAFIGLLLLMIYAWHRITRDWDSLE